MASLLSAGAIISKYSPFATIPKQSLLNSNGACHYCFRLAMPSVIGEDLCKLKRCSACRQVAYCSQQCQRADWSRVHQLECRFIARAFNDPRASRPNLNVRLLARCILRASLAANNATTQEDKDEADAQLNHIEAHTEKFAKGQHYEAHFAELRRALDQFLAGDKFYKTLSDEQLRDLDCRSVYHSKKMTDCAGVVVLPSALATLKHSCRPNACIVQREDGFLYLIAIGEIEKEEEIRISFVSDMATTKQRREVLQKKFGFRCDCTFCAASDNTRWGTSRDNYLRSIRCSSAFGRTDSDGGGGCNAPCPMTTEFFPASSRCANNHPQTYTQRQLGAYEEALEEYKWNAYGKGSSDLLYLRMDQLTDDPLGNFETLAKYWHSVNSEVLRSREAATERSVSGYMHQPRLQIEWEMSSLPALFVERGAEAQFKLGDLGVAFDPYRHFCQLQRALIALRWGASPVPDAARRLRERYERDSDEERNARRCDFLGLGAAGNGRRRTTAEYERIGALLRKMAPSALTYFGEGRRARAWRRLAEMTAVQLRCAAEEWREKRDERV